jgi:CRP-like cAMP-binding protein
VTIEDDIAFLARVPTFAKFGFAALQIIAIGSEARQLADGETLFTAGETTDAGYVIQEGSLTLTAGDPRFSETAVTFGPGTLIGELALLTETLCSATAVAAEPATVIRISRNLFRKVLEGFPDAARLMRDRLIVRVHQSNEELVHIRGMLQPQPARAAPVRSGPPRSAPVRNPAAANQPAPSATPSGPDAAAPRGLRGLFKRR